jgi:putative membrane protein
MNFIDYVTLLLINMVAAFFILGCFVWRGPDNEGRINWAPAFAICGLVATIAGFTMTFTSPIPKPYSMAFGEMSVMLGVLFLGTAWALSKGWELMPLAIYGFVAGAAAVVLGVRMIELGLTAKPVISGIGFILSGMAGVLSPMVIWQSEQKGLRIIASLLLFAASAIWAVTGYIAYWMHLVPAK